MQQETEKAAEWTAAVKQRIVESAAAKVDAAESTKRAEEQRITAAEKTADAVVEAQLDDAGAQAQGSGGQTRTR
jgi:hypothetical protein